MVSTEALRPANFAALKTDAITPPSPFSGLSPKEVTSDRQKTSPVHKYPKAGPQRVPHHNAHRTHLHRALLLRGELPKQTETLQNYCALGIC